MSRRVNIVSILILSLIVGIHAWGFNKKVFRPRGSSRRISKIGKGSSPPSPAKDVTLVPLTDIMKGEFVTAHNLARSTVEPSAADMREVEWDNAIAKISEKIVKKCVFKHSDPSERTLPGYPQGLGENLFVGMAKYHIKPEYITQKWDEERKYYNYQDMTCLPGKMCGHYTQVVWSSTTKIGCAIAKCSSIDGTFSKIFNLLAVCHYGPPGNWRGMKPYKLGESCSQCPADENNCVNDLCTW